ncbi:extracellular solute-binding protein [Hydrogenoanaerobacterium saccharovorans]|uniref:Extracellular solute-binding protein n=1 Tax=Hydrogenoanaerobacterium saccharovorans TaxID=474960 RepID=A0ABS2GKX4_9FIRM|nr:substrate-binding domain-containing protein [Hydrogenoanaerobacterium saccharovorans]MBM6923140.1 extracellular solute-binding protein [Hydrogenoanaerobacterium saccharovorans]MBS5634622.1 extracellular solute-binding protein [Clostridiales bacterium]
MKKFAAIFMCAALAVGALSGCSSNENSSTADNSTAGNPISVVTREDGSGTRGAFVELFGIEDADGNDAITQSAEISNSTSVVMTTVAGNPDAIGYISLGSLNNTVKALEIDGVAATVENINNGTYKVYRPFNIATKEGLSETAQDFVNFIMSEQGQAIVAEEGYISVENSGSYTPSGKTGTVTVSGSSSVTPVMQVLKEEYEALNPDVTIELQQSDSTTGVNDAIAGTSDIGMASRALKDSELEQGVVGTVIANDGIAVIVNNESTVTGLTSEQVKGIYMGELTNWSEVA